MSDYKLSKYQLNVINHVKENRGHLIVESTAGSGKTFILVEISKIIKEMSPDAKAIFVAFNKSAATELGEKLNGFEGKTINSLFFEYYRENMGFKKAFEQKYWKIVNNVILSSGLANWNDRERRDILSKQIEKCVRIFRATLVDLSDVDSVFEIAEVYGLTLLPEYLWDVYNTILTYGDMSGRFDLKQLNSGVSNNRQLKLLHERMKDEKVYFPFIDFTDQLWIPYINSWITPKFDYVLADEVQDLNVLQRRCLLSTMFPGGKFIGVGDPFQAIYLFSGSASSSIDEIVNEIGATVLPLSVIYRCPSSHVQLAQQMNEDIESFDGAIEGTIEYEIEYSDVIEKIRKTGEKFNGSTLVMSRRNAPLVSLAYRLVASKVPFLLKGRDFGKAIAKVVSSIAIDEKNNKIKEGFEWNNFPFELDMWYDKQVRILDSKRAEKPSYISLEDKRDSIIILYSYSQSDNPFDLIKEIDELFPDEGNGQNVITLCSIHKAKGLERDSTFILEYDRLPFTYRDITEEQAKQEDHLLFVALTRSKNYMGLVNTPPKDDEDGN